MNASTAFAAGDADSPKKGLMVLDADSGEGGDKERWERAT